MWMCTNDGAIISISTTENMQCIHFFYKRHQSLKCSLKRVDTNMLSIERIYFWIPFVSNIHPNLNISSPLLLIASLQSLSQYVLLFLYKPFHIALTIITSIRNDETCDLGRYTAPQTCELDQAEVSMWSNLDCLLAEYLPWRAPMK